MARKLKVFAWSDGLHAYTLATTSRAQALAAWGFKRDLFKDGEAKEITEGKDYELALAKPGETIERRQGADAGKIRSPPAPERPRAPSKAQLERVSRLEKDLAALARRGEAEMADIEQSRRALEARAAKVASAFDAEKRRLEARLAKAEPTLKG